MDQLSEIEALRNKNLADNKVMLAQMMEDLKSLAPPEVKTKCRTLGPRKYQKRQRRSVEPAEIRRNPRRNVRSRRIPVTRIRTRHHSGSSESETSSEICYPGRRLVVELRDVMTQSAETDYTQWSDFEDDENNNQIVFKKKRREGPHRAKTPQIRPFHEITEADIDMVADICSEKQYDSELGSSCHQCRQKTIDQKTMCRSGRCFGVRGQFCGPCLRNRYGEDAKNALRNPDWMCPPCRGICNCSFCRKKNGKSCTGILIHLAREQGYDDCNSYLQSFRKSVK